MGALPTWADSPATWAFAMLFVFAMSVLYAITSGRLLPRATVNSQARELKESWEARLEDAREREEGWKAAYQTTEAARDLAASQLGELLVLARATDAVLRALPLPRDRSET